MAKERKYDLKSHGRNKGKEVSGPSAYPAEVDPVALKPTRCPHGGCTRILFKGSLGGGTDFEIQCPSCGGYLHTVVTVQN